MEALKIFSVNISDALGSILTKISVTSCESNNSFAIRGNISRIEIARAWSFARYSSLGRNAEARFMSIVYRCKLVVGVDDELAAEACFFVRLALLLFLGAIVLLVEVSESELSRKPQSTCLRHDSPICQGLLRWNFGVLQLAGSDQFTERG